VKTILAALCLSLSLAACKTSPPVSTPRVPPSEAVVRCPSLNQLGLVVKLGGDDEAYGRLADLMVAYGTCATRHDTAVDYIQATP
jgi:hypothetical protein